MLWHAIAETLIYACKEAGIASTHKLLGHEGVTTMREQAFDFVVLDVGLPDMTGFDVCKQIRAVSNIPILFLTARNHEIDRTCRPRNWRAASENQRKMIATHRGLYLMQIIVSFCSAGGLAPHCLTLSNRSGEQLSI